MSTREIDSNAVAFFQERLRFQTTPSELRAELEKGGVVCLDVRDKDEFQAEHIPGAINIPLGELERGLTTLPREKTIVVYCCYTACRLAPMAALLLAQKGFRVRELIGGLEEWGKRAVTGLLPVVVTDDVERLRTFYRDFVGLPIEADEGNFVQFGTGGSRMAVVARGAIGRIVGKRGCIRPGDKGFRFELYFRVKDAPASCRRLLRSGAALVSAFAPRPWGDRAAYFLDPDENLIAVADSKPRSPLYSSRTRTAPRITSSCSGTSSSKAARRSRPDGTCVDS